MNHPSKSPKYRPVFTLDDLQALQLILHGLDEEKKLLSENKKLIIYIDLFIFKISSGTIAPQYSSANHSAHSSTEPSMKDRYFSGSLTKEEESAYENGSF